jgi:hypothetical protein
VSISDVLFDAGESIDEYLTDPVWGPYGPRMKMLRDLMLAMQLHLDGVVQSEELLRRLD